MRAEISFTVVRKSKEYGGEGITIEPEVDILHSGSTSEMSGRSKVGYIALRTTTAASAHWAKHSWLLVRVQKIGSIFQGIIIPGE
jgi:hypothetical protein